MKHWKHWMMSTFKDQEQVYKNIAVAVEGGSGAFFPLFFLEKPFKNVVFFFEKTHSSSLLPTRGRRCSITL